MKFVTVTQIIQGIQNKAVSKKTTTPLMWLKTTTLLFPSVGLSLSTVSLRSCLLSLFLSFSLWHVELHVPCHDCDRAFTAQTPQRRFGFHQKSDRSLQTRSLLLLHFSSASFSFLSFLSPFRHNEGLQTPSHIYLAVRSTTRPNPTNTSILTTRTTTFKKQTTKHTTYPYLSAQIGTRRRTPAHFVETSSVYRLWL